MSDPLRIVQRVYVNGFPKSGLHLAEQFVNQVAAPIENIPWLGNVQGAWTGSLTNMDAFPEVMGVMPAGAYLKGHTMYTPTLAETFWDNSVSSIFVYRDLRDVAVSAAHHVLDTRPASDGDWLRHPGKQLFQAMESFEDVLVAIIEGVDEYPGVVDRWRWYKGWLDEKWVLPIRFEDMRLEPASTGSLILRYVTGMAASFAGIGVEIDKDDHDMVVERMVEATHFSTVTKRKGLVGGWADHWTDRIERVFDGCGGNVENRRLGY